MKDKKRKPNKIVIKKQHIDFSDAKPPRRHAVYAMIENLRAAAGTDADNSPKKQKRL